jgi:uncharacterized protein YcfL
MKKVTMIFATVAMFAVVSCGSKKAEEVVVDSVEVVEADTTAVDTASAAGVLEGGEVAPTAEEAVK